MKSSSAQFRRYASYHSFVPRVNEGEEQSAAAFASQK
jgi:hypothetical protein